MAEKPKDAIQFILNDAGKKVSVVLPIEKYEALLEDISDLAAVAERRGEETVDHEVLLRRLKADGLL